MTKINELKDKHTQLIRKCFYDGNIWIKNDLSKSTGISKSLTTNILQDLLERQEIVYRGMSESTGGRKSKQYFINKDYYHLLQVVLLRNKNRYFIKITTINMLNDILFEEEVETKGTYQEIEEVIETQIRNDSLISILTISLPGVSHDQVIDICDFEQLIGMKMGELLQKKTGLPIVIENDVNVTCIGFSYEYSNSQHVAFFYQPNVEYVGCGLMICGKLYNGFSHFAGELRYLPFYDSNYQQDMLKKEPLMLLKKQIETLCCVMNPEVIGICSKNNINYDELILDCIPSNHQPKKVFYNDIEPLIEKGLYHIGMKQLLKKEGKK